MRKEDLDRLMSRGKKRRGDSVKSKSDMMKQSSFGSAENSKFLQSLQNIKLDDKKKKKVENTEKPLLFLHFIHPL